MKRLLEKNIFELLILAFVAIIFVANHAHGTYLMGWDNLQTDLNPWLGVQRAVLSVWEEYQSFGLVAGNAHAADLIRAIFIWLISFILPQSFVRYVFHMLMVLIGGLGMLKLLEQLGFKSEKKIFAFLGAVFYIFNLGTVQIFFLPYEAFSVFFAALPWELWIFIKILNGLKHQHFSEIPKKELVIFILINILATPQNFIQTIFVVYMILLGVILLVTAVENKSFGVILKGSALCALIIMINSFWIVPQGYFLKTSGNVVKEAKTNVMATSETVYQNKEKGTIPDFLKMEGFYYDLADAHHQPLFLKWQQHFQQPVFAVLPYLLAAIVLLGIITKRPFHNSFITLYSLMAVVLLSSTVPFSFINDLFRSSSFINQVFRSPFTKFIIPYSLIASYLFTSGLFTIYRYLQENRVLKKIPSKHFFVAIGIVIILYAVPVFQGYYFSPVMKVALPDDYLQTIKFFNQQDPNKRVALLPEYTVWGWFFTKWGFNGSGFLWYGIEQPIVSRTFDVWSNKSESYYWEMKSALESEDLNKFQAVLEKYNIDYLVLDTSLLPVSSTLKGMQYDRTTALLKNDAQLKLVQIGKITSVYQVIHPKKIQNFTTISSDLPNIGSQIKVTNEDTAYLDNGDYKTESTKPLDSYYPFLDLMSQTPIMNSQWQISEDSTQIYLKRALDPEFRDTNLASQLATNQPLEYLSKYQYQKPLAVSMKNGVLTAAVEKQLVASIDPKNTTFGDCTGKGTFSTQKNQDGVTLTSSDKGTICFSYVMPSIEQRYGYLLKISSRNTQGPHLFFYLNDRTKQQTQIEDRLQNNTQYYILPSRYQYGVGYDLVFHNDSYKHTTAINTLQKIQLYRLPYDELRAIQLIEQPAVKTQTVVSTDFQTTKQSYYIFTVRTGAATPAGADLVLYQQYHSGWKAYQVNNLTFFTSHFPFFFGTELKDHFSVNNWANGWNIESPSANQAIVIVFWPQYLEYGGFVLLGMVLFAVLIRRK